MRLSGVYKGLCASYKLNSLYPNDDFWIYNYMLEPSGICVYDSW